MKLKEEMRWHLFSVAEPLFMEIWMLNVSVKRAKMRAVTTDILFDVDCEPLWVPLCSFQNFAACFATLSERCSVHVEEQPHPSQNPRRSVVYELAFWAQVTWKVHLAKETSTVGKRLLKASHLYFFLIKWGLFPPLSKAGHWKSLSQFPGGTFYWPAAHTDCWSVVFASSWPVNSTCSTWPSPWRSLYCVLPFQNGLNMYIASSILSAAAFELVFSQYLTAQWGMCIP